MSEVERVGGFALVLLLALLCALWSAFLVPLRVAGVPVPAAAISMVTRKSRASGRTAQLCTIRRPSSNSVMSHRVVAFHGPMIGLISS